MGSGQRLVGLWQVPGNTLAFLRILKRKQPIMKNNFTRTLLLSALLPLGMGATAQTWTQKTDHPDCRYDGAAFAIDGMIYYGAGITCPGVQSNLFRKFDPVANTWTPIAPLPADTRRMPMGFALNGKGYVVGGIPQNGIALDEVWEYDPIADSWTQKNDFPGGARCASAAMVCNGKAYICGGLSYMMFYDDMWEYAPLTDTWTQKADIPVGVIQQASAFAIGNNCYVVFGKDNDLAVFNDLWKFNTITNTWSQMAEYPGPPRVAGAAFAINGVGYAGFGFEGLVQYGDFHSYDPATDEWTPVVGVPGNAAIYDAGLATATKGYCVMRTSNTTEKETWEFAPGGNVGLEEPSPLPGLSVTSIEPGMVVITAGERITGSVQVIAANGQLCRTLRINAMERREIELPSGLYLITMESAQGAVRVMVE